jgi:hypothetical protein
MSAINVDLVFVIDISGSMKPCIDKLRRHLDEVIKPLQGYASSISFGLVAMSVTPTEDGHLYNLQFVQNTGHSAVEMLYSNHNDLRNEFFTENTTIFTEKLADLTPIGDEDMLLALDIAADMPFGPVANTKRVIAVFSDEPFEGGILGDSRNALIPELIRKLQQRHIQLFVAIPDSDAVQLLSGADRSEIELVAGGEGLISVDFKRLLLQMGKSISITSLQSVKEPDYKKALFGQNTWVASSDAFDENYVDQ